MNKKIVYITGCLGFMGSYLTRKCLEMGWIVKGVDKISYTSNTKLLEEFNKYSNFSFIKEDICNLKHLYDCDYVINYAAESHVENSIISSQEFINTNIQGVKNILELIRHKPISCNERPVLFHISTDEVYGDVLEGAHTEQDLLKPSNPYSASKASGDMLILAWARTYGIEYNILRPTNNYGIGQYPEKLIPLTVKNLSRGKKIKLHNNGTPTRNWLHAEDTALAVIKIIESGKKNEIYNVAGGFEQANLETVKKIIKAFKPQETDWEKYIDFSYNRIGQDLRYSLDDSKLKNLGWSTTKNFDKEIQNIVDYYKNNFIW
jgi:dTDP-glucose 4,6-dehydratase